MTDLDQDDLDRVAKAIASEMGITLAALRGALSVHTGRAQDRVFVRRIMAEDPLYLSDEDRAHIRRLAWRYRRFLPSYLVPKLNPDDPVVRALEAV